MRATASRLPYLPITNSGVINSISTAGLFQQSYSESGLSPIDQYIRNNKPLNIISSAEGFDQNIASIVLLGYMSAVESYLRAVFRGVITIDEYSQKMVENMDVTYAAAIHHKGDILPDALFEGMSLANPKNIKDTLRNYLGIKNKLSQDVEIVLLEFTKICELRHCCVHRFGKLGAKNAVRLGLSAHHKLLDKPLNLSQNDLEEISYILRSLVNSINRYIFESLLDRMANNKNDNGDTNIYPSDWNWNYNKDRKRFMRYYLLFSSKEDTQPSPSAKNIYNRYRDKFKEI